MLVREGGGCGAVVANVDAVLSLIKGCGRNSVCGSCQNMRVERGDEVMHQRSNCCWAAAQRRAVPLPHIM
jgi:hypothetical protein